MKKTIALFFTVFMVFTLSGCGSSVHEELQANDWQAIQSDGQSGNAEFREDTMLMTESNFGLTNAFHYQFNEDETEITLTQDDEYQSVEYIYDVEKEEDDIRFILTEDSTGETEAGFTITLTPANENEEQ